MDVAGPFDSRSAGILEDFVTTFHVPVARLSVSMEEDYCTARFSGYSLVTQQITPERKTEGHRLVTRRVLEGGFVNRRVQASGASGIPYTPNRFLYSAPFVGRRSPLHTHLSPTPITCKCSVQPSTFPLCANVLLAWFFVFHPSLSVSGEKGPSSIRPTLELFQKQQWAGKLVRDGVKRIMDFPEQETIYIYIT